ncbi:MAG: hypothetical protein RAP03_08445 [Candidatus Electryonea clarkiae]|nr:hypothetical protein [Candidatus Electryonea clarkiae]MDP8314267.1 hypothetical protein [Candidatus Celaenobacter antarcticus]
MPRKAKTLSIKFNKRIRELNTIRLKMETLFRQGIIDPVDVEEVYAGIFLDIFTEFEALIDNLFFGLVEGEFYSVSNNVQCRVEIIPKSMVRDIVFAGKKYLDWLPYTERTIPRAKRFFNKGIPFTLLDEQQESDLKNYNLIRNSLAHKSDSATTKFKNVISGLPLLPNEKTPTGYLRSIAHHKKTQYEIAIKSLQFMAEVLCA